MVRFAKMIGERRMRKAVLTRRREMSDGGGRGTAVTVGAVLVVVVVVDLERLMRASRICT